MSVGIRNKVAIIGMGCTRFGELWNKSAEDLMCEAVDDALRSVPAIAKSDIEAYWLATLDSGYSGLPLAKAIKVDRPVTRVENFCASGSDALRNAVFAVASGMYDIAMAVGVEKLKDSGYSGLAVSDPPSDNTSANISAPGIYAMLPAVYSRHYGVSDSDLRRALTHVAWKNHRNGSLNRARAQFTSEVSKEKIDAAPRIAGDLSVFDCSGVADGAAAAIIVPAERAQEFTDTPLYLKALALHAGMSDGAYTAERTHISFPEVVACAKSAYSQAGITNPERQISLAEVHDCFTPTELILMEDLGFSKRGNAWQDILNGKYDLGGLLPVNSDGGLKSFGHPVGASGLRMIFELWLQFRGEAGERQHPNPTLGMAQNMGGYPGEFISFIGIFGKELSS